LAMVDATSVLREFYNLAADARGDFDLYRSVFEDDPKSTELCANYAPLFFGDFNHLIIRALVLHVCKLTDRAHSFRQSNLTTNYILEKLSWPADVKERLSYFNDLLMAFRNKIDPARNKRIAHTDLDSQINRLEAMGTFDKGEDTKFFLDLQSFLDVAYRHVHEEPAPPIAAGGSTDTYKVIRAIEKAILYDRCPRCTETQRANDVLDFEGR